MKLRSEAHRGRGSWELSKRSLFIAFIVLTLLGSSLAEAFKERARWADPPLDNIKPNGVSAQTPLGQSDLQRSSPVVEDGASGIPSGPVSSSDDLSTSSTLSFLQLVDALEVMQARYFELWQGTWPDAIDWTAAVLGSYLSGALTAFSTSFDYVVDSDMENGRSVLSDQAQYTENLVNKYFSQLTTFYFGQDAFGLRTQAYDDMLWVVLAWLDGVKFINLHSDLHYNTEGSKDDKKHPGPRGWYGKQFIPAFAHRARIFYDLASHGWDTKLCGGGMVWSPYLEPYKNAITNELFIAASVSMYLYFPGDHNSSPFSKDVGIPPAKAHDPKYLTAALDAYKWISTSNMTNAQGLYVDGYHVRGYGNGNGTHRNRDCDDRNEMVYTYNQGVLLTGYRGLWESTGARSFLDEGHVLLDHVIHATGRASGQADGSARNRSRWAGLGRNGILEEICDASGTCSQNGQTFKGIFFHHLAYFCSPLPSRPTEPGLTFAADAELRNLHTEKCTSYGSWVKHNGLAASDTRNQQGEYGTWWGDHRNKSTNAGSREDGRLPEGAVDYRNEGLPLQKAWRGPGSLQDATSEIPLLKPPGGSNFDVNDRGRGRTVETQGGAISVLRAMWEMVDRR